MNGALIYIITDKRLEVLQNSMKWNAGSDGFTIYYRWIRIKFRWPKCIWDHFSWTLIYTHTHAQRGKEYLFDILNSVFGNAIVTVKCKYVCLEVNKNCNLSRSKVSFGRFSVVSLSQSYPVGWLAWHFH